MGLGFDFYRIVRRQYGLNKVLTLLGDLLFSLAAFLVIFFFAQKANYLEFRFYLFGGTLLGLILYLRLLSPVFKKLFSGILKLINFIVKLLLKTIKGFFAGIARILIALMSIPYGILSWFSMLIFRLGEALGRESVTRVKGRLTKTPRE